MKSLRVLGAAFLCARRKIKHHMIDFYQARVFILQTILNYVQYPSQHNRTSPAS